MQTIPLNEVVINEERRQRREFDEDAHQELMKSLTERGQLQPIIIDGQTGELLAGERRFRAAQALGWDQIECKTLEDLDEAERMLIQYDENIKRRDLDWKSHALAVLQYHRHMVDHFGHTAAMTASHLNMSPGHLSNVLYVAEGLLEENPLITEAQTFSVAKGIMERKRSREAASALDSFFQPDEPEIEFEKPSQDATTLTHGTVATAPAEAVEEGDQGVGVPFLHADFNEWQQVYSGPKFNMIHCDFPYGVDTDKHNSSAQGYGAYEDSEEVYFKLLDTLESAMDNVVSDSAHLIFWFSMDFYQITMDRLAGMGWRVNHFPLIWHKTDKSILPDSRRGPRRQYETAFLASRGDRLIVRSTPNVYSGPATKEIHKSEKPVPMLRHFLKMLCDDTSSLLDPTMGSGNAVRVGEEFGGKALGLERDPDFFKNACIHYRKNQS